MAKVLRREGLSKGARVRVVAGGGYGVSLEGGEGVSWHAGFCAEVFVVWGIFLAWFS